MASIRREIQVAAEPERVWDALRDVVTFGNGMSVRERIIDVDDTQRRVAWSAEGEPFSHYNASVQAFAERDGRTRLVWIADLLPNELEPQIAGMIDQGMVAMKRTLEQDQEPTA